MRQFVGGLALGLLISTVLRRIRADKYHQERIDLYYVRRAKSYQTTDQWVSIGGYAPRIQMRRLTLDHLNLQPGQTVLDIACGTGANFPYILERIGPTGRLVGLDYSAAMLEEAQRQVDQHGWQNVTLLQHDAANFQLNQTFDAVLCVLGMVVIPDYINAMQRAIEHTRPGGRLAIADLCENQRWYMQPFNKLMEALDATLITDTTRRPWELMQPWVEGYRREELLAGYMYVASGRKPLS
jgi:demethylmenaquinone methyltransferase/2-methoxy-6-polyprenyl-1,4-benzoquinol methylase